MTTANAAQPVSEAAYRSVVLQCRGQLSLPQFGLAKSSISFGWGSGGNVTSAGWQVTLCDPIWHVISRGGVAELLTKSEPLYRVYFTYLFLLLLSYTGYTHYRIDELSELISLGLRRPTSTIILIRIHAWLFVHKVKLS